MRGTYTHTHTHTPTYTFIMSVFGHKLSKYAVVPMRAAEYEEGWVCCAKGNVC